MKEVIWRATDKSLAYESAESTRMLENPKLTYLMRCWLLNLMVYINIKHKKRFDDWKINYLNEKNFKRRYADSIESRRVDDARRKI